ncbi:MAG TPA: transaminase [Solirubrobacteraceae bacterium]|nr:transaminase [Solirubrobacteraceae bacterium]
MLRRMPLDRVRLEALHAREAAVFTARTARSAAHLDRAREHMPDGVPMAWMAGLYDHRPVVVAHGAGCRFSDLDGNAYLDFNQADLSATCGFAPQPVLDAIAERAARGLQFLLPVEEALDAARLLAERYPLPAWQFTLSASGANQEAIRLARHATGRELIVVFGGHYHGHLDDTLVEGDEAGARPGNLGLNSRAAADTRLVPFNDAATLERVLARGGVAAVITEPALTNVGVVAPDPGFHASVRELTREHGALLILDETHTQTAAHGGCTGAWGLEPDVITLGKSLGGGIPVGAYGMTAGLRDHLERHRDAHGRVAGIATGGTTYANPLSLAAVVATLTYVQTPEAFERTAALGALLADGIEAAAARHGLPWRAHRLGGRSGYCLEPDLPRTADDALRSLDERLIDARRLYMANRGIWEAIASAGPAVSFAHEEADVDEYLTVLEGFLDEVVG